MTSFINQALSWSGLIALYIRRPRIDEERVSRGMQSELHASDYFLFETHLIVDENFKKFYAITEDENKYEGYIAKRKYHSYL